MSLNDATCSGFKFNLRKVDMFFFVRLCLGQSRKRILELK